jgi:predicted nucleic acid-binding protein
MSAARTFADTNVLLYLLSGDAGKADRAEALVLQRPVISVQVLNELVSVTRRKLAMSWEEVNEFLLPIRAACQVEPLSVEVHDTGLAIARRHGLNVYDAMIAAAALVADCGTLWSEDMQHGLVIEKRLKIVNPFRA